MTVKAGILDLSEVATAIKSAMPGLLECGTASDLGRVTAENLRFPACYVIPLAESPGDNRYQTDAIMSQRVIARFGVIWSVRDIGERFGDVAQGEINVVRARGMEVICSLRLTDAEGPCVPATGKLVSGIGKDGQMLWQDDFAVPLNRHIPIVQGA